ncbi:unnamed protein product [Lampetra fluviatilis]
MFVSSFRPEASLRLRARPSELPLEAQSGIDVRPRAEPRHYPGRPGQRHESPRSPSDQTHAPRGSRSGAPPALARSPSSRRLSRSSDEAAGPSAAVAIADLFLSHGQRQRRPHQTRRAL